MKLLLPVALTLAVTAAFTARAHEGGEAAHCPAAASGAAARAEAQADVSRGLYRLALPGRVGVDVLADCATLPGANLEMAEVTFAPRARGAAPTHPNHSHPTFELFYVVSGTLRYGVGDRVYELGPGGLAIIRPGTRIFHEAVGDTPLKLLAVWTPAGALEDLRNRFGFVPISPSSTPLKGQNK